MPLGAFILETQTNSLCYKDVYSFLESTIVLRIYSVLRFFDEAVSVPSNRWQPYLQTAPS